MTRVVSVLIAAAAAHALIGSPAAADEVILGVLEQPQCKKEPAPAVRVLFRKQGQEWTALNSEEASRGVPLADIAWTVAYRGRRLGSITVVDPGFLSPHPWTYPRDRLLRPAPDRSVPAMANGEGLFGGWCEVPKNRPLVVVSRPNFEDPQRWRRFSPGPALRSQIFSRFAGAAGEADTCESEELEGPSAWEYSPDDLLFSASYRDHAGTKLVGLRLDPARNRCDGPRAEAWATHWFVVGDSIRFLGVNLSLVDAADYDADGVTEVLFWYSGSNEDGYSLFYDGLRRRVDYLWKYH